MTVNLIDHMPFAQQLGLELTAAEPSRVEAKLTVGENLCTTGKIMHGGAIMAALFLQEFVGEGIGWAHVDLMGWNLAASPGKPEGGEAMSLRAMFAALKQRFG